MMWRRVVTEKRHFIWPLALAVIANAALMVLVLYPLSQKVTGGEQQAQAAAFQLDAARRDYAAARATVTGKEAADKSLRQFYESVLPPDLSGARRSLTKIEQLLVRSNLRREGSRMRPEPVRDSNLSKLAMTVEFTGNYPDVRRFIYAIETAPEFLVVENVELMQESDGKSALKVTATVATYYRTGGDGN
jgi:Tfp pilus assembly protein PilO